MITPAVRLAEMYGITHQQAQELLKLADEREVQAALEAARRKGALDPVAEARIQLRWKAAVEVATGKSGWDKA